MKLKQWDTADWVLPAGKSEPKAANHPCVIISSDAVCANQLTAFLNVCSEGRFFKRSTCTLAVALWRRSLAPTRALYAPRCKSSSFTRTIGPLVWRDWRTSFHADGRATRCWPLQSSQGSAGALTREQALRLAAWLAVSADPGGEEIMVSFRFPFSCVVIAHIPAHADHKWSREDAEQNEWTISASGTSALWTNLAAYSVQSQTHRAR
jgi:hypothetical protein